MVQHKVVYIILAQLSFAFFFSCLLVTKLHNVVPRDWNATAWTDFSEKVSTEFDIATASRKLLLLLTNTRDTCIVSCQCYTHENTVRVLVWSVDGMGPVCGVGVMAGCCFPALSGPRSSLHFPTLCH